MRFLLLCLALVFAACGSSDKPSSTGPKKTASAKKVTKKKKKPPVEVEADAPAEEDVPAEKVAVKKKPKPKPFEPAPLESLADRGTLKAAKLGKPVSKLEKICPKPKKKKGKKSIACACWPLSEASTEESWEANAQSCSAPAEGLEAPFVNVQLLGVQQTSGSEESPQISAAFQLLLQTKKGWSTAAIGSTSMVPAKGNGSTYGMESRSFADLVAGGNQELMAIFEEKKVTFSDEGERSTEAAGWLVVCSAGDPKKIYCTAPVSLGAAREEGGYLLEPIVEGNALYLRETTAQTPEELAKTAGKYTLGL